MPQWTEVANIYSIVSRYIDAAISILFGFVNDLAGDFSMFVTLAAIVYIALMGYALMSGLVSMSLREVVIKLSKVLAVLVLLEIFRNFNAGIYQRIWDIPDGIGTFIVRKFNPLISETTISILGVTIADRFDALMNAYSDAVTVVSSQIADDNSSDGGVNFGLISWFILMAPMFLTTIAVYVAKFVSAVLFVIAPVIFGLSLFGYSNNYLSTWFKSLLVTFLTVIIVYIVGAAGLSIVLVEMFRLGVTDFFTDFMWTVPNVAPLLILSMFTIMLLSQAPTMASAIIGAAAINTQQATSFLQIGALQSAR